jgi:hypothetical protein
MTSVGRGNILNSTVAIVAVPAWFAGTNHCLLGLLDHPLKAAHPMAHCPEHSKKSGETDHGPSRMLACCQGLQSANFEVVKAKIAFSPRLVAIGLFAVGQLFLADTPKSILPKTEYDTGLAQPGGQVRHPEFRPGENPTPSPESDRNDK